MPQKAHPFGRSLWRSGSGSGGQEEFFKKWNAKSIQYFFKIIVLYWNEDSGKQLSNLH